MRTIRKSIAHEDYEAWQAWHERVKSLVKRSKLDALAKLIVHHLTQDVPDLKGSSIPKIIEQLEIWGEYPRRQDLLADLKDLYKVLAKRLRQHIELKHRRERDLLDLWEKIADDHSPLWRQEKHDIQYDLELRKREERAALKAARLALVKTLQAATAGASERG